MMKYFIVVLIIFGLMVPSFAQLQNFEGVEIKLLNAKRTQSEKSDVLELEVSFINKGQSSSQILLNTLFLVDSKSREFSSTSYLDLKEKGYDVSSKDCPLSFSITINPELSVDQNLCFEIPKETGLKYSLKLYSSTPEICKEPIFDCTIKEFPIEIGAGESTVTSKIPEWVRNIFIWYGEKKISEDELIKALQFLIKQGIIKV